MQLQRRDQTAAEAPDPGVQAYEERWGASRRVIHHRPHLWRALAPRIKGGRVLEIGPGLRTTAPVRGSFFIETSPTAARTLRSKGGRVLVADGLALPFADGSFRAVFAFEVLEHVDQDVRMLGEMSRVLAPGGLAVISVPAHMARWSATDVSCHHVRRYEPDELLGKLGSAGLVPEGYSVRRGGGHPKLAVLGSRLLDAIPRLSNWWLQNVVFTAQSAWHKRAGVVRWTDPREPVDPGVGGMMVLCQKGPESAG